MNKKKKIIIVFIAILIPLYFIIIRNNEHKKPSNNFIINKFSDVNSVVIKKNAKIISLKKNLGSWYINDKYKVNKNAIIKLRQALLETKINKPVSKNKVDSAIKVLKNSKNISIYTSNNKLLKKIYLSDFNNVTKEVFANTNTLKTPYVISIPGLEDDLNQRYNTNPLYWINPEIFTYQPHEIKKIEVHYSNKEKTSYKIEIEKDKPKVFSYSENKYLSNININKVGSYLSYFMNVKFSDFNALNKAKADSLKNTKANFTIIVTDLNDLQKKVELYKIKDPKKPNKYDINKLYAIINKEDIVIVKYFDFDLILKDINYFKK